MRNLRQRHAPDFLRIESNFSWRTRYGAFPGTPVRLSRERFGIACRAAWPRAPPFPTRVPGSGRSCSDTHPPSCQLPPCRKSCRFCVVASPPTPVRCQTRVQWLRRRPTSNYLQVVKGAAKRSQRRTLAEPEDRKYALLEPLCEPSEVAINTHAQQRVDTCPISPVHPFLSRARSCDIQPSQLSIISPLIHRPRHWQYQLGGTHSPLLKSNPGAKWYRLSRLADRRRPLSSRSPGSRSPDIPRPLSSHACRYPHSTSVKR